MASLADVVEGRERWAVHCGDSRDLIRLLPDNSVHSVNCDPPYFISFMSSAWDSMRDQAALDPAFWAEVLRVLKPGGHVVAFGYPRTVHRLASAIEDAGFQIRDQLGWFYGSAMPKGKLNVGKLIDEAVGAKRPVTGEYRVGGNALTPTSEKGGTYGVGAPTSPSGMLQRTAPVSDGAKQWEDWAALLKIAHEPVILARKPFTGTLEMNVLAWGCGALNVGATRVPTDWNEPDRGTAWKKSGHTAKPNEAKIAAPPGRGMQLHPGGRHTPNVLLDELAAGIIDAETGEWVSRYFPGFPGIYAPKCSRSERDAGLDCFPLRTAGEATKRAEGSAGIGPHAGAGRTGGSHNPALTVKPIAVMEWFVRLTTPIGGITLDPFLGSGSTLCAAIPIGVRGIGFERECVDAMAACYRVRHWEHRPRSDVPSSPPNRNTGQIELFGDPAT